MDVQIGFVLVRFLHDLFTAVWIGGLITLGVAVLPSIRKHKQLGIQVKGILDSLQKRLNIVVLVSIIGLWLTGVLLANRAESFGGFLNTSNLYSMVLAAKHTLVILMTVVAVFRTVTVVRFKKLEPIKSEKLGAILLIVNIALGIIVLFLSAYSAAL